MIQEEGLVENDTLKMLPEPSVILGGEEKSTICHNAVLIGNTKTIWPVFLNWLASKVNETKKDNKHFTDEEALQQISTPFDTFVQESILQALLRCCKEHKELKSVELFWSNGKRQKLNTKQISDSATSGNVRSEENYHCFREDEDSFLVSMQRIAVTTGEYWHDMEATKLCVHPEYGTWTAFRTVVVFDTSSNLSASTPLAPPIRSCPITGEEIKMAKTVFDYALRMSSSEDGQGYGTTLNKSWEELCDYLHGTVCSGSKWENVPDSMKPWIQLRDCISVGREKWKYSQEQLLYHYTRDSEILRMELDGINT
eukprot:CAMPEP_0183732722 /NCGR_PEP_ID=MMETSP0737-20130205/39181_1 /TAXON_ID=385413 /ORGANISM="Thalassiosira miniscula, Strain CCMP1093" /LENGTH=311 /DNA_ID=CAMNT_0025965809 /DNA_START=151 /DNA_END=1086 /DNA_ORIENTATION=+